RPSGTAGAGAPQRESHAAQIGEQARRVHPVAADVEIAVIALAGAAVDRPAGPEGMRRSRPQFADVVVIAGATLVGQLRRRAEAHAQSRRQCPRAQALLLSAAMD